MSDTNYEKVEFRLPSPTDMKLADFRARPRKHHDFVRSIVGSVTTILGCVVFSVLLYTRDRVMPGFDTPLVVAASLALGFLISRILSSLVCGLLTGLDYPC